MTQPSMEIVQGQGLLHEIGSLGDLSSLGCIHLPQGVPGPAPPHVEH